MKLILKELNKNLTKYLIDLDNLIFNWIDLIGF